MIFLEPSSLGWKPMVQSWLLDNVSNQQHASAISSIFDEWLDQCIDFVRRECTELCETLNSNLARSMLNILQSTLNDAKQISVSSIQAIIMFSIIWSVGAMLNQASRTKFNIFFRALSGKASPECQLPPERSVYDYALVNGLNWKPWTDLISEVPIPASARFADILVQTIDTIRYTSILRTLSNINKQVLFVGPTGTGRYF
jgi:dynein heavy chain